ncbi:putative arabinan endo-1,5-alpha-L-arabinosidase A [Aureobasidium pullulans]|uniref:Arabinan endo-1,5-alpha-L-arabinosidase n=1 Tax=Aureobasidium pullulans TaxID=5580 RepID=A0A4S8VX68_AURPU|nr:putative arabinan endo-1,5-alpha-L-arabinosidase A [Aureobasidium pullulans]THW15170.1 putative arabinan endo-1,5-alpha-L-arabinosidase A [Aureobasidium pullulans]THW59803.1 putative arabinan endo-1,5-alpha-L-arabinosidase A [Aureobasidium pullulans]THZ63274.1 putative arabinan endo-1,5-alpha-L-arabinosidase A [Aureobasidium pullulans]
MKLFTILSGVVSLAATVLAYSNPLSCSGTCTNAHDPSLIKRTSDGTYFRFSTGGGIAIHTASSIQGPWVYKGQVLPNGANVANSGKTDLWAPDVSLVGSTYYLYYTASSFGTQNSVIGLATSSTMDVGSWSDKGSTGISSDSSKSYNAIDANLIKVGSQYLMNFGSFWHDIYQVEMKSTPNTVSASAGPSYNTIFQPSGTHAVEGAYMINYNGGYYMFFSEGICCGLDKNRPAAGQEYKIKVCRSNSATGGFVDQSGKSCTNGGGTVVLPSHGNIYAPGGQGVYNDPSLGWVLYYHYVDTTIGYADGQKRLGVNEIKWVNGWPTV